MINRLASNLVTFEYSPYGSMANHTGKKSKLSWRTRFRDIYSYIIDLELLTMIIKKLLGLGCQQVAFIFFKVNVEVQYFKQTW